MGGCLEDRRLFSSLRDYWRHTDGERLKHIFLIVVLAFSLIACSHNPHGVFLTQAQVTTILGDASAGMNLGCAEEWLPQNVCDIGNRIIADAQAAANGAANGGWAAAAKAVLVLEESRLPPDSRLRPYFDAAIPLL